MSRKCGGGVIMTTVSVEFPCGQKVVDIQTMITGEDARIWTQVMETSLLTRLLWMMMEIIHVCTILMKVDSDQGKKDLHTLSLSQVDWQIIIVGMVHFSSCELWSSLRMYYNWLIFIINISPTSDNHNNKKLIVAYSILSKSPIVVLYRPVVFLVKPIVAKLKDKIYQINCFYDFEICQSVLCQQSSESSRIQKIMQCTSQMHIVFLVQVRLRTEVPSTPSLTWPGSNSWSPDHDSTVHVTETTALIVLFRFQ